VAAQHLGGIMRIAHHALGASHARRSAHHWHHRSFNIKARHGISLAKALLVARHRKSV